MTHRPSAPSPRPTRESIHLGAAKRAYVMGRISLAQFEGHFEQVLAGGHLTRDLHTPSENPSNRSTV